MTTRENLDQITESIIGAAIEVHRALGTDLLESAYDVYLTFDPTRPEGWHSPGGEVRATSRSPFQILCVLRGLCGTQIP